jgi:SAM-dependent methyltransferase
MLTTTTVSPRPLIELGTAFWASKTLLTAVEMGLFTELAAGPASEPQLRERLGLHSRSSRDFLDSLVSLGVLDREDGRYRNTPASDAYLDEGKPGYLGGWMRQASRRLFVAWGGLTESLRTGKPHIGSDSQDYFRKLYADLDQRRAFIAAMDAITNQIGPELSAHLDWSSFHTVLDVGGARGNLLAYLLADHPELHGAVFDMPELRPLFEEHTAAHGIADRTRFLVGDFFGEPLPEADVLIFGHILHDWDEQQRRELIRQAYQAVRPGGAVVVYDRMIDDDRRENSVCLLGCLNLLLVTPGGSEYTVAQCRSWLAEAGFADMSQLSLVDGLETAVIGRKH